MKVTKVEKIVYYAEQQVHHNDPYVWSGQGEKLKSLTVLKLCEMETTVENAKRVIEYIYNNRVHFDSKTKIYDCSGLACKALEYAGIVKSGFEATANDLYLKYGKVPIGKRQKGDLIFKINKAMIATHVGIVYDEFYVIEAKGRDYGVVKSKIDSSWNACNRPIVG